MPIRIAEFRRDGRTVEWLIDRAQEVKDVLAEHGTALMYRTKARTVKGKRLPGSAEVFADLVDGIACGALVADGGVTVFGLHFDAELTTDLEYERALKVGYVGVLVARDHNDRGQLDTLLEELGGAVLRIETADVDGIAEHRISFDPLRVRDTDAVGIGYRAGFVSSAEKASAALVIDRRRYMDMPTQDLQSVRNRLSAQLKRRQGPPDPTDRTAHQLEVVADVARRRGISLITRDDAPTHNVSCRVPSPAAEVPPPLL